MILEKVVKRAAQTLKDHNIPSYELDAQIILSNIMKMNKEYLITHDQEIVSEEVIQKYDKAIKRRTKREPVAYIIEKKGFWTENFIVNSKTLVPRPETELLIYKLISFFKNKRINILDIGTGSGCILLSLLKELKYARGIGIDVSSQAIGIAKKNSRNLNLVSRSNFKVYDLKKYNSGKYDLIVSNPPYIRSINIRNLSADITKYEPIAALDGGVDGLDLIKKVIYKSNCLLKTNGLLALEIGHNQYKRVSDVLKKFGYREIHKEYDYGRNVRCIISTR